MKRQLSLVVAFVVTGLLFHASAEGPTHAAAFSDEGLFKADFKDLKDTRVVAHPDIPLEPGKNVLWCGTLQLAWNKAIGLVGEKLHFVSQPPVVNLLNLEDFTEADLDPACYVAIADFERNHVEDEIRAALQKTFGDAASPELIPPIPEHPLHDDFLAYAYLFKNLAFEQPFEDKKPFEFDGVPVKNFGIANGNSGPTDLSKPRSPNFNTGESLTAARRELASQVSICSYESENNFVIKIRTKIASDELILAKIPMPETLQAGISYVVDKASNQTPERMEPGDTLSVPKLNFDLRGDFPKLEKLVLQPGPDAKVKNLVTSEVRQLIRFQLNEKGPS